MDEEDDLSDCSRKKRKLLNAVEIVKKFTEDVPGGDSYWINDEGGKHTADMGYAWGYLNSLSKYLRKVLKEEK